VECHVTEKKQFFDFHLQSVEWAILCYTLVLYYLMSFYSSKKEFYEIQCTKARSSILTKTRAENLRYNQQNELNRDL